MNSMPCLYNVDYDHVLPRRTNFNGAAFAFPCFSNILEWMRCLLEFSLGKLESISTMLKCFWVCLVIFRLPGNLIPGLVFVDVESLLSPLFTIENVSFLLG